MEDWTFLQKLILRCVPFRFNQFLQTKVWKKGMYFEGMSDEQRSIAARKFFGSFPITECPKYGPPFEPPWLVFPDYEMHSMGFRMGSGEDYNIQFSNWYNFASLEEIESFKQQFPEIEKYSGYYSSKDKWLKEYREKNDHRN